MLNQGKPIARSGRKATGLLKAAGLLTWAPKGGLTVTLVNSHDCIPRIRKHARQRRGVIAVLAALLLVAMFSFIAFAIETGRIAVTKTNLQNACDAAALAAVQEISSTVKDAGQENQDPELAINAAAIANARQMAARVAQANGVYVDPERDVRFGNRRLNPETNKWEITWNQEPYNVAGVQARRDQEDTEAPDGKLKLAFGWAVGKKSVEVTANASAFVESRDIVVVMDFSGSMNDDSELKSLDKLGKVNLEENIRDIYNALGPPDLGDLGFEPEYLRIVGPLPQTPEQAHVAVTFKAESVFVESTKDISKVRLQFSDGTTQTSNGASGTSGEFSGTGLHQGKDIRVCWVTSGENPGSSSSSGSTGYQLTGAPPTSKHLPQIQVTFYGNSVTITSSKDLSNVVLQFNDGTHYKFDGLSSKTGTFAGVGSNAGKFIVGCWVKSGRNHSGDGPGYGERFDNPGSPSSGGSEPQEHRFDDTNENVKAAFGLDQIDYPYPSGSWDGLINHARYDWNVKHAGYRKKYGGLVFVNYLLESRTRQWQTPDLWKTPHYPFHAVKNGVSLLIDFLSDLGFADEVGVVSYDEQSRVEKLLDDEDVYVNLGDNPITNDYQGIDTIQRHKQAGQYGSYTGMGYGVQEARKLLLGDEETNSPGHMRYGSRPTIILMTDGLANRYPQGWSLPSDFSWDDWTDFDNDGSADYSTFDTAKQYAFWEASESIKKGVIVHTLSVGLDADRELMKAIAFAGQGLWIDVPGGGTVNEMQAQLLVAFGKIAGMVPPSKLTHSE